MYPPGAAKAGPGRIVIADAPIQSTVFDRLVTPSWKERIRTLAAPCPVDVVDLRKSIWRTDGWSSRIEAGSRADREYVLFDLGPASLRIVFQRLYQWYLMRSGAKTVR